MIGAFEPVFNREGVIRSRDGQRVGRWGCLGDVGDGGWGDCFCWAVLFYKTSD